MDILLTCGGTAGHINPALAVAGRIRELMPDSRVLFLGAEGKMEMELVPREGFEIKALRVTNLSRGMSLKDIRHNLATVRNVISARREAARIIRDFRPDVVLGTGGYVCYPVLKAAAALGVPAAIHESNAVPGLTTKLLAKSVDSIMVGFEDSRRFYPDPAKIIVTGTPVRGTFASQSRAAARRELGLSEELPLVLSVWGSLGARHMNDTVLRMLPLMRGQKDFRLLHATGSLYTAHVKEKLEELALDPADCGAQLREYIYDMPRAMAAADLILCRAGASTLAELSFMGKPALIVPSPNVTNDHQEKNARVLERAGAAKVLLEGEFDEAQLLGTIRSLLEDRAERESMSRAMGALAVRDAAERICDEILRLARR